MAEAGPLEDLRQIREDVGLRAVLRLPVLPSADATGDWLRRMGDKDGLAGLAIVNQQQIRRALKRESITDYTLDLDATQIVAEKQEAKWTYKGGARLYADAGAPGGEWAGAWGEVSRRQ